MFNKHSILWLLTTCILLFAGCSDDLYSIDNKYEEEKPFEKGLTIYVPRVSETRAFPEGITEDEVKLHSLTLFLLRYENDSFQELVVKQLKDEKTAVAVTDSYNAYNIEDLKQGTYKVYICANIFNDEQDTELAKDFVEAAETKGSKVEDEILARTCDFGEAYFKYASDVNGLPMSCLHSEIRTEKTKGALDISLFNFTGNETLYADMTFALAKVTVEVEGAAGENIDIKTTTHSDYLNKFTLFDTKGYSSFNKGEALSITDRKDLVAQPVYVSETNTTNDPKLALEYEDKKIEISLGEENEATGHHDVLRGHHYEYVVKRDGTITLTIKSWEATPIDVEINAPFELILEKTKIDKISSAQWEEIIYTTDAESIEVVSPKFENTGLDFYKSEIKDGVIRVTLNDQISLTAFNNLSAEEQAKYKYFHVKAQNLMKRVDVGAIEAKAIFNVTPQNIIIDLREYVASAKSRDEIEIEFATNLSSVSCNVQSVQWKDNEGNTLSYGSAVSEGGKPIFKYDRGTNTSNPSGIDKIIISGLDEGLDFFKTRKTFEVTYTVDGDADQLNQLESTVKTVRITIIPYTSSYTVHFMADNGETWTKPHIYVYQCLQLPYGIANNGGRTVGLTSADQAALEYCFTSDFAFRGWKDYGGDIDHNNGNGTEGNGFIKMDGFEPQGSYNALNTSKYKWMAFNTAHYEKISGQNNCKTERCGGYNENVAFLWPGIVMYQEPAGSENEGWWTYEISGVADPGRTLIMFNDGHTGNDNNARRFPGHEKVGVPLFDYEDKEGWFVLKTTYQDDYINNHFYDDCPEIEAVVITGDFDFAFSGGKVNAYFWNGDDNNGWPGKGLTQVTGSDGNTYYCLKTAGYSFTPANVQFVNPNNNNDKSAVHNYTSGYIYNWNGNTGKRVKFKRN